MSIVINNLEVDNTISGRGVSAMAPVVCATTGSISLASLITGATIDGITLTAGMRVLVKDQSDQLENGVYDVGNVASTRSLDFAIGVGVGSCTIRVSEGTVNNDTGWTCTNPIGSDIIGTNDILFQQISGTGVDGDVYGPNSSTLNGVCIYSDTTGKLLTTTPVVMDAIGNVSNVSNLEITGAVRDSNDNELIEFHSVGSAVNNIRIDNATTGNSPGIDAVGDDTNINLTLRSKGTGKLVFNTLQFPLNDGTSGQVLTTNGSGVLSFSDQSGGTKRVFIALDQKTNGVTGGTFTAGAWQTHALTTSSGNGSAFASLSSNQVTLQPGTYYITGWCVGYRVNVFQTRVQNITSGTTIGIGTVVSTTTTQAIGSVSIVSTYLSIVSVTVIQLQARCTNTRASDGFGIAGGFGVGEVYAALNIEEL